MADYVSPEVLLDADEKEIYRRMVEDIPIDIDTSEGSIAYDLLHPTAVEVERIKQFDLDYLFQQIWPQFAEGVALDYHGEARGLRRKQATPAVGILTVTGEAGTIIEQGDLFATEGYASIPSMSYQADEETVIPEEGVVDIAVTCTETGSEGNCTAGKVIVIEDTDDAVEECINNAAFTGGTDEEDDDAYRQRILDFDQARSTSYSGSMADYRRWANEVSGVGSAIVIPAQDDSGLVTIVITDGNGDPATEGLCEDVYNYIMKPDDPYNRLAPINALLSVIPPIPVDLDIAGTLELRDAALEDIENAFIEAMQDYYPTAISDGEIRYQKVANILGDIDGVYDFTGLTVNGGTSNIPIEAYQSPVIQNLNFTLE